jgi:DNA-3-methyladenine glycosylase
MVVLSREFYDRHACLVARDLLGATLVRRLDGQRLSGMIVETEAYTGLDDLGSHGRVGKTPRNLPMWEAPGHAYVYFTYGMHWLLNVVCEPEGQPAAVLIRAAEPLDGADLMALNRPGVPRKQWTNGPARLTLALGINGAQNRVDMTSREDDLWIEAGLSLADDQVSVGPRVGLGRHVREPWLSMPWRWWVTGNADVSCR